MSSFLKLLFAPRAVVALAVVVVACWFATTHSVHHHGKNPFETLYFHLVPTPLVKDNSLHEYSREDYLLTIPAPGPLAVIATAGGHGDEAHADDHGDTSHADDDHSHEDDHSHAADDDHSHDGEDDHAAASTHAGDDGGPFIALSNLQVFQLTAVLLVFILLSGVPGFLRTGRGDAMTRLFAGFALWIRDEMVYPVMGKELGGKFLPYFLTIFFFILFMNLLGLVPGSATATSSIFVTGALALTTLGAMLICGMVAQGPVAFWKNLVPHVPIALWPLMFVVEVIGIMVKPFALMIRLFANMTGGHMVVLSFMGLIFFFGMNTEMFGEGAKTYGFMVSPVAVAFGVFIMIIEAFVAMLQAYIFTQLSIIFVGAAIHPEH